MNTQLQTLKGFRDFLPAEKRKRDFVMAKIKEAFELYGFEPLETPTLEYASLLLGKYGAEADKLVYKFEDRGGRDVALRYDQTVPTSRVLVQYQGQLPRVFRRYQMQNAYRAEKPQKGRFREFTQCDVDIFGSVSPLADAEIIAVCYQALKNIGFKSAVMKVNDRKILTSTLEPFVTEDVNVLSIIQTIDKLDKQSQDDVINELVEKGLQREKAEAALKAIQNVPLSNDLKGIIEYVRQLGVPEEAIQFTPTLARGLDYYTGMIVESSVPEYGSSSVGGGGRYDKLIEQLGGINIPAVGFAFGFDRVVEIAEILGLLPAEKSSVQVLVAVFNEQLVSQALSLGKELRDAGISSEIYPGIDSLGKQFKLADQKQIPYVAIIGETEAADGTVTLKNMVSGDQTIVSVNDVIKILK